jgi:Zn-dependent peptidase ImmA (M78 family)/transcriptional regulator with XRE-family HTH domain
MPDLPPQSRLFGDHDESLGAAEIAAVFDPARLTQARCLAGMTKAALADRVGVSAPAVTQWEARSSPPRPDHLRTLSEVLDVPLGFFAAGRPHARLDASTAHFRSLRSTRSFQRAKAVVFVEQVWELTHALEKRIALPSVDLPGFVAGEDDPDHPNIVEGQDISTDPVAAAGLLRQRWGLGVGPIPHLIRTMETRGIVTTMVPFAGEDTPRIDAFSTSRLPRPLVILTPDRANDVYWHRFTAAHELGHLLLHRDSVPGDPMQEQEANQFAAELLTPAASVKELLPSRIDFAALERLGREWGVSVKSLIYRSRELGALSDASARRAYQKLNQLISVGLLPPEPVVNYPGEVPSLLAKAFTLAEEHRLLTLVGLARELQWRVPRLRLLLGQVDERPALRLV